MCLICLLCINSDIWYGEVCIQRGGIKFGNIPDRCGEDEQFISSQDSEQVDWVYISAASPSGTPRWLLLGSVHHHISLFFPLCSCEFLLILIFISTFKIVSLWAAVKRIKLLEHDWPTVTDLSCKQAKLKHVLKHVLILRVQLELGLMSVNTYKNILNGSK